MDAIEMLADEAQALRNEKDGFVMAKKAKAAAEDAVLRAIVEAVRPALPAISSKVEGMNGPLRRAVNLGGLDEALYLGEQGDWFVILTMSSVRILDISEVLDRTSLSAVLAVLLTSIRAQAGKLRPRTDEVRREAQILEGIAAAFKAGGVR